jgi:hypothetical protein
VESADVVPGLVAVAGTEQRDRDADAQPQLPDGFPASVEQGTHATGDEIDHDVVDAAAVSTRDALGGPEVEAHRREPPSRPDRRIEGGARRVPGQPARYPPVPDHRHGQSPRRRAEQARYGRDR